MMDEELIRQMRPVLDKVNDMIPLGWYDYPHLRQVKEWLIDDTLDRCGFTDDLDKIEKELEISYEDIISKIKLMMDTMKKELVLEIKQWLDEINDEGDDEDE